MLQTEADERWERQANVRPSRFHCPVCRTRINVDQVICTKCGLDFRTGDVLGKNQRLNEKGLSYLRDIPWLVEARRALGESDSEEEPDDARRSKAPRKRKKRSSRSFRRLR
jgi:predicted nucleic acid-binding Zn ribbon protein